MSWLSRRKASKSPFEGLPPQVVLHHILPLLEPRSLGRLAGVSRATRQLMSPNEDELWKHLYQLHFPQEEGKAPAATKPGYWNARYIERARIPPGAYAGPTFFDVKTADGEPRHVRLKGIFVGDTNTGKSALVNRFAGVPPTSHYNDFRRVEAEVKDMRATILLWDTAGQERFRAITRTYYRGSSLIFLTYDAADRETFDHIERWVADIRYDGPSGPLIVAPLTHNLSLPRGQEYTLLTRT